MEDEDAWLYGDEQSAEVSEEAVDKPVETEIEENVSNVDNLKFILKWCLLRSNYIYQDEM